jgi:hypothetical protein
MDLKQVLERTKGKHGSMTSGKNALQQRPRLRIATEERPYVNDLDLGPTGEQNARSPGQVATGNKLDVNREQPGTGARSTGNRRSINREQEVDQPGTTGNRGPAKTDQPGTEVLPTGNNGAINREQGADQPGTTGNRQPAKADQPGTVPGFDDSCSRLDGPLFPVEGPNNREQPGTVPGFDDSCSRLQPGTRAEANREQKRPQPGTTTGNNREQESRLPLLPSGAQQLRLLHVLADYQQRTGLNSTPRLKRETLAADLNTTSEVIKTQTRRLCAREHLERLDARDGRGDAGTVYRVPLRTLRALLALNREQQPGTTGNNRAGNREQDRDSTGNNNREQEPDTGNVVGSSSINTTDRRKADDEVEQAIVLERLVERLGLDLDPLRIGANDLLDALRSSEAVFGRFTASVEHIAFYLRGPDAKGLTHARAWAMKQLRRGYYPPPPGFISWEEQQLQAEMAAAKEKLARLQAARVEKFDTEFDLWIAEKTTEELAFLLKGSPYTSPTTSAARLALRSIFGRTTGQEDVLKLAEDLAAEVSS